VLEGGTVQLAMDTKASSDLGSSSSTLSYKWSPGTFLDRDNILNPFCSATSDQTYTLTVTNSDNCSSSDQVNIRLLKNPIVPNTFTPNGDGINDEWTIKYLNSYPKATINIFNRYGVKVFSGDSKSKSWDAKYNGQDLPIGTYYYVIDPHNGRRILSGSITILR
ncbi:gliding motility-associated C-terminal domain-containing protein, partial [Pedobacter gandavensis]|uniref:gliding motility-associated C-terminal domain-containing protein n=1 Tax=Pedobacter gandavensis TaxID=2679963 RepID=UPI00293175D2